jgi:adenylylsulfate kinase
MGLVIWLTGLPCSGKTTLGDLLAYVFQSRGYKTERLDGDQIRKIISSDLGFSREDRKRNVRRVAIIANNLAKEGKIVICSFVSPYARERKMVRGMITEDFFMVFVACTIHECIRRDVKGMYQKAFNGEIKDFTGVDQLYEFAYDAESRVWTDMWSKLTCIRFILDDLRMEGLI